jgi:hypothetical protein
MSSANVLTAWRISHNGKVKVKVEVTLRLAVYRQSLRRGDKPLEAHDQQVFF